MRNIFLLLFVFLLPVSALADCPDITNRDNCNASSMCLWDNFTNDSNNTENVCMFCENYDDYESMSEHVEHGTLKKLDFSINPPEQGWSLSSESCPLVLTCNEGYTPKITTSKGSNAYRCFQCDRSKGFFNDEQAAIVILSPDEIHPRVGDEGDLGSLIQDQDNYNACKTCGLNATPNDDATNCDCKNHYHTESRKTTNVGDANCVPKTYRFLLYHNPDDAAPSIYIDYGDQEALCKNYPDGDGTSCFPTLPRKNFLGWYAYKEGTFGTTKYPFGEPELLTDYITMCEIDDKCEIGNNNTIKLYAKWEPKTYTVKYCDQIDGMCKPQLCKYTETCTVYGSIENIMQSVDNGFVFGEWKHRRGGLRQEICYVSENEDIMTNECLQEMYPDEYPDPLTLTVELKPCPKGYYCIDGEENECPPGTTSDDGASTVKDCYIHKDTVFKDKNNPNGFKLPLGESKIYIQ